MKNKKASRRDKKEIKVTYISSPVKVKTSASNFRALVQELTGQYSNVAETTTMPMEEDQNDHSESVHRKGETHHQQWRVDDDAQGTEHHLLKNEYTEFLSRSYMEPLNQHHLQYDLLSFDMA